MFFYCCIFLPRIYLYNYISETCIHPARGIVSFFRFNNGRRSERYSIHAMPSPHIFSSPLTYTLGAEIFLDLRRDNIRCRLRHSSWW